MSVFKFLEACEKGDWVEFVCKISGCAIMFVARVGDKSILSSLTPDPDYYDELFEYQSNSVWESCEELPGLKASFGYSDGVVSGMALRAVMLLIFHELRNRFGEPPRGKKDDRYRTFNEVRYQMYPDSLPVECGPMAPSLDLSEETGLEVVLGGDEEWNFKTEAFKYWERQGVTPAYRIQFKL